MARAKIQMQRMQIRMKLSFKHDIRYAQHFAKINSERCQASQAELYDFNPLKFVIAKRSALGV